MRLHRVFALGTIALGSIVQAQVRVSGRVSNDTNSPIAGARVSLEAIPPTQAFQAISDPNGAFRLQVPTPGDYLLRVDREGYYLVSGRKITVPPPHEGSSFELQIGLQSVHEILDSVDVRSQPGMLDMDRAAPQSTLSSRTLYNVPFSNPNNLRSGLPLLPGVLEDSVGGIHVYGGSEDQAQYSFEGFQLNDPLTGRLDARMSLESVQSIDVQASPSGAEMGRGAAGTMLLHARMGDDQFRYSVTNFLPGVDLGTGLRVSSWNPRGNFSGPWRRHRAWFFNTAELQYVRTIIPQLPSNQNSTITWRWNDLLHNQINLTPRNILFIGFLVNDLNAPRSGLSYLDPRQTTVNRRSSQVFGYVKDQHSFSHSSLIEFGFAVSLTHSTDVPQGAGPYLITPSGRLGNAYADARRDAQRQQGLLSYYLPSFQWLGTHQVKTGADIVRLEYEQNINRSGIEYLNNSGAVIREIAFTGSGAFSRGNTESAFYVQDSWRVRPWLLVEAGWRADDDRLLSRTNSSARAGFALSPPGLENTRISGGYARIFDSTNLRLFTRPLDQSAVSSYFDPAGNLLYGPVTSVFSASPNLKSPHADVWNIGFQRTLPKLIEAKIQLLRRVSTNGFDYLNTLPFSEQLPAILAGTPTRGPITADYLLSNQRRDQYNAVEVTLHQSLRGRFEWMASYTRSRASSNAVMERTIDQPLSIVSDGGPLPWDAPNRFLSWGYLPAWGRSWAIGYLLDWHSGLPFSVQDQYGQLAGAVDDHRFPAYFALNVYLERRLSLMGYRLALRAGVNNVTSHPNPNVVDNVLGGPTFLSEYGGQGRILNFRFLFLGRR